MSKSMKHNRVLNKTWTGHFWICADCGGLVDSESEWLGEDANGKGWFRLHERCEECGNHIDSRQAE